MNAEEIDGRGFIFHFYHYLWLKDPLYGTAPRVRIPDTIYFKWGKPKVWYFSN
jgi:hypothetical protein